MSSRKVAWFEQSPGLKGQSSGLSEILKSQYLEQADITCFSERSAPDFHQFDTGVFFISKRDDFSWIPSIDAISSRSFVFESSETFDGGEPLPLLFDRFTSCDKVFLTSVSQTSQFNTLGAKRNWPQAYYLPFPISAYSSISRSDLQREAFQNEAIPLGFAFAGGVGLEGRIHKILPALRGFSSGSSREFRFHWMLCESEVEEAMCLLSEFSIDSFELVVGKNANNWLKVLETVDLCFHTSYSVFQFSPLFLPLSLSQGKIVIVNDIFDGGHLPPGVALKVKPGFGESNQILQILENSFSSGPGDFGEMARSAVAYADDWHSLGSVSSDFASLALGIAS